MTDPDLEKRGGGGGPKNIFSALRTSVWSKNKGGGTGPPSPSLRSATGEGIRNLTLSRVQGLKKKIGSSWHNILRLDYKLICF